MDVRDQFPVRKNKQQKQAFRDAVCAYAEHLGYPVSVEKGSFRSHNVVMGDPENAKYLVTAHYDTCAWMPFPNFIMPCNVVAFALHQIALWVGIILVSSLLGAFSGVLIGKWAVSLVSCMTLFAIIWLMIAGPANPSNCNDNTSGVVTLLEILRTMPENQRSKVCFVLFDLEEAGLIGSSSYRKAHKKASDHQMVLNLDCVGDGDHILLMPNKKARMNEKLIGKLKILGGWFGNKQILTIDKGFCQYNSDHKNFPLAVGIGAFHKKKGKTYTLDKIHTKQDTNLDITNVNLLRAALITFICGDAV